MVGSRELSFNSMSPGLVNSPKSSDRPSEQTIPIKTQTKPATRMADCSLKYVITFAKPMPRKCSAALSI
jgi:hypothetical protein